MSRKRAFGQSFRAAEDVKIFKISLFAHSACYYFGVRSTDERWAEEERSRWVLDVSRAVRLVTQSLFPPYRISCEPQQGAKHTASRLMAGYVVQQKNIKFYYALRLDNHLVSIASVVSPTVTYVSTASVVYCELHAHQGDFARVTMYENDLCQVPVAEICIHESAMCSEKIGINCSCFSVEDHQFSSRTLAERKLWLRAAPPTLLRSHAVLSGLGGSSESSSEAGLERTLSRVALYSLGCRDAEHRVSKCEGFWVWGWGRSGLKP
ncbi:unnamed protein product [Symbiodinium natans]|uniref:PH domain-containing protein n=1 Tax=Symbiodinium natans TaxID=878477 RepID=A0A812HA33_9DINO|nr:unnamed protein product [Symbiodinium natans]